MELIQEISDLDRTIQSWGYATVKDFAWEQAKNILQQKMAYYKSKIDFFEQKYGSGFDAFCQKFNDIKNHSIIEKEDDSLHWETALDAFGAYQSEFEKLII